MFSAVEELRLLLIEHRELHAQPGHDVENERRLIERAESIVSRLDVAEAHQMAKAFAIYFELTNLAETNHRKRRRRNPLLFACLLQKVEEEDRCPIDYESHALTS